MAGSTLGKTAVTQPQVGPFGRVLRWVRRGVVGLVLVLVALLLAGIIYEAAAEAVDRGRYPAPGQLLDVGGYKLHIHCTGEGSPTVVLHGASLDTVSDWVWVRPEVSKLTRVCAYDRAGLGWSDPGPWPPDTLQNAEELHTLLWMAGAEGPYVQVGHSFGGLYARAFAGYYPDETVGMVLVEGTHPDFPARLGLPEEMPNSDPQMLAMAPYAARVGLLRLINFVPLDPNLPQRQRDELKAYYSSAKFADTALALYNAFPTMLAQVRSSGDLYDKPLMIVVGSASENASGVQGELQDELLGLSSNSARMVVEGADHVSLVRKQEHAVQTAEAIAKVVLAVRENRPVGYNSETYAGKR